MKRIIIALSILAAGVLFCLTPQVVMAANQPPHVPEKGVNCDSCHLPATDPVWAVGNDPDPDQNDPVNRICWKCHDDTIAPFKKTHSSTAVGSTKYGDWKWNCVVCHNPHQQTQTNFNTYIASLSGAISVINAGTRTFTLGISLPERAGVGTAGPDNDYAGWTIVPNKTYKTVNYKIASNTATTVTVTTAIATTRVAVGSLFGILPGRYVKDVVNTPGGAKYTRFFALEGQNSFVNNDGLAGGQDSTPDGVCQICHGIRAQGAAMSRSRADGTGFGDGHPTDTAADCNACHDHSQLGFGGGGCNGCHGYPPDSLATLIFKDKNGLAATSSSTLFGQHTQHVAENYSCENCHNGGMLAGAAAGDNRINLGFKIGSTTFAANYAGQAVVAGGSFPYLATAPTTVSTGATVCSNLYCHSNVQGAGGSGNGAPTTYAVPKWDGTVTVQCGSCHDADGVQGTATTMSTGTHTKHANAATGYGRPCSACHANPGAAGHVNYSIAVTFNAAYGGTYNGSNSSPGNNAPGLGYGNCSTTYCHSDGKATPNTVTSVTWGGAATTCTSCHGGANSSAGGAGTTPLSSNHPVHTNATYNYGCADCHNTVAFDNTTIANKILHVNKTRDVSIAVAKGGDGTDYNSGAKTCATTNCHGTLSPAWGTDLSSYDNCTICHGTKTAGADGSTIAGANPEKVAPGGTGTDTSGVDNANTDAQVGAHQAHLAATHSYSSKIACSECHTVPASVTAAGHIDSALPAEVPLSGTLAATNPRSVAGTPGYTSPNCSNVYCHDYQRFKNGWADDGVAPNANRTPVWNVAMLGGADDCQMCHGFPPAGSHPAATANQCTTCHNHVNGTGTGFSDATKHVNGLVEASGCDGCHGNPPTTATYGGTTGMVGASLGSGDTGATSPLTPGAHDKHVNGLTGRGMSCDGCHSGSTMPSVDAQIQMGFAVNATTTPGWGATAVTTGTFTGYNALSNSFTFVSSSAGTTVNTAANRNNNCSALYCHGSTLTGGSDNTPDYVTATTGQCGTCHGASAASAPTAGSHAKHASTTGYSLSCQLCHPAMPANEASHVDGSVAWSISTTDARSNGGTYKTLASSSTGGLAPSAVYGSCATLYCHGNFGGNGNNASPTWGSAASGACGTCHDVDTSASMSGGSHDTHVKGILGLTCDFCHKGTAVNAAGGIQSTTLHVNGSLNWDLDETKTPRITASSTYRGSNSGTRTTAQVGTAPYGSCGTIYCHSNVQTSPPGGALTYATPTWGGSVVCGDCHKASNTGVGLQDSGSHTKHVSSAEYSIGCQQCHQGGGSGFATHANGQVNLNINATWGGTYGGTAAPGDAYGSCSTVYCHSAGQSSTGGALTGGDYKTPTWGTAGPLGCAGCHTNMDSDGAATGSHIKHAQTAGIACATCHSGYTETTVSTATHVNKSIDVTMTGVGASASYNGSNSNPGNNAPGLGYGNCSSVTCHSSGQAADGTATPLTYGTPTWGGTLDCGSCHKNMDTDNTAPGSHVKHAQTYGISCATCHNGYTETTVNAATHNNSSVNLSFSTTASGFTGQGAGTAYSQTSTSPLGNGYGTCSTSYCHSNGSGSYKVTPTWGTATTGCNFCHDALPITGAHADHVNVAATVYGSTSVSSTGGVYNFGCGNCHPKSASSHGNGTVDIVLNDGVGADPLKDLNAPTAGRTGTGNTTVCNLTYCHSDGSKTGAAITAGASPQWGSAYAGDRCAMCHGNSPATGSHPTHIMAGIHFDNIYTGTTGLKPATTRADITGQSAALRPHGNSATATTINCNICHNGTVNVSYNALNTACSTCHNTTSGAATGDAVAVIAPGSILHLNGVKDIAVPTGTVNSKAQIRDDSTTGTGAPALWTRNNGYKSGSLASSDSATINASDWASGTKTCTTACHLGQQSPTWGSAASCNSCHTTLP